MTTEIFKAIFTEEFWGPVSADPLIVLGDGESINARELKKLGVAVSGLAQIIDRKEFTSIIAKEDKKISVESLTGYPAEVTNLNLKNGLDIGVRRMGEIKRETIGIQVRNIQSFF